MQAQRAGGRFFMERYAMGMVNILYKEYKTKDILYKSTRKTENKIIYMKSDYNY